MILDKNATTEKPANWADCASLADFQQYLDVLSFPDESERVFSKFLTSPFGVVDVCEFRTERPDQFGTESSSNEGIRKSMAIRLTLSFFLS